MLELANQYAADPARSQGVSSFSGVLLTAPVPAPAAPPADQPVPPAEPAPVPVEPASRWPLYLLCCLLLLIVQLIVYILGRRQFEKRRKPTQQVIDWAGEGPAPYQSVVAGPTPWGRIITMNFHHRIGKQRFSGRVRDGDYGSRTRHYPQTGDGV